VPDLLFVHQQSLNEGKKKLLWTMNDVLQSRPDANFFEKLLPEAPSIND
jgi:hypothetical protein